MKNVNPLVAVIAAFSGIAAATVGAFLQFGPIALIVCGLLVFAAALLIDVKDD